MNQENLTDTYNDKVRRQFDQNLDKWYFSIVDVLDIATESRDPRNYWKVLKNRLKASQNQLVTSCNQLKMEASDGKFYLTDVADGPTITQILKITSQKSIPQFEAYLGSLSTPKGVNVSHFTSAKPAGRKISILEIQNKKTSYPHPTDEKVKLELPIDMYMGGEVLVVKTLAAGTSLTELHIAVTSQTLTINGVRNLPDEKDTKKYHMEELSWGKFSRTIELPYEIDIDKVEAVDMYGLLTITMRVIDKSYTRRVKIRGL
jgi:HSP20 family molecular chaperone IbpA